MADAVSKVLGRRRFDVDDVLRMVESGILDEQERVELIEGDLVEMGPQPAPRHCGQVDRMNHLFAGRCADRCQIRVQNPLRLDRHNLFVPDLALLRPDPDFYRRRYPGPEDTLLVVEIAESSLARDRKVKLPLYARAGVPLLWIVDLRRSCVRVFERAEPDGYGSARRCELDDPVAIPEDGMASVTEILGQR